MRDFPFNDCPTASDLSAFLSGEQNGGALPSDIATAIAKHLETCLDCARVRRRLESLNISENQGPTSRHGPTDAGRDLLEAQRLEMAAMLTQVHGKPEVGQVWTTSHSWSSRSASNPVIAMLVVVLRIFTRPFTNTWVVDVAPVTEDLALAAEWSLVFPPGSSGGRAPLVAHLDYQVTTTIDALERCLGKLSSRATKSLLQALEAYDAGNSTLVSIEGAYFGHETVRNRPEWHSLQHELQLMVTAFAKLVPEMNSGGVEKTFAQPFEEEALHESLPRAPTDQQDWARRAHAILGRVPHSGEDIVTPSEHVKRLSIAWDTVVACLQDPQTCKKGTSSDGEHSRVALWLGFSGHPLNLPKIEKDFGWTLGYVIVSYVCDEAVILGEARQSEPLPSPDELRLVENLSVDNILGEGGNWRERVYAATGQALSPSTLRLIDRSLKFAKRSELNGAPLLAQAARRQSPT